MDIKQLITHKQALLKAAQDKVSELQQQIAILETIASEDAVDTALAGMIKPAEKTVADHLIDGLEKMEGAYVQQKAINIQTTAGGRNPKGSVRSTLLSILSDGNERDLDYIENEQGKILPKPISRVSLRTTLMTLKNEGEITSRKHGYFQLAQKE